MLIFKTRTRYCVFLCLGKYLGFFLFFCIIGVVDCIFCVVIVFLGSGCVVEISARFYVLVYVFWVSIVSFRKSSCEVLGGGEFFGLREIFGVEVRVLVERFLVLNVLVLVFEE